jgi:cell division protein ZapA
METQRTRITIMGDEYPVLVDGDAQTTKQVADYVDRKIAEIRDASRSNDKLKTAVMAALNIAGELFEYRSRKQEVERRLEAWEQRAERLTGKINEAL